MSLLWKFAIACLAAHTVIASRELPIEVRLTAGLEGGGLTECWNALLELRSCTNEVVLFFLNGESYLGPECCRAVGVITRQCWPTMLTSLGFTSEEGDIVRGYCDAEAASPHPPVVAPSVEDEGAGV